VGAGLFLPHRKSCSGRWFRFALVCQRETSVRQRTKNPPDSARRRPGVGTLRLPRDLGHPNQAALQPPQLLRAVCMRQSGARPRLADGRAGAQKLTSEIAPEFNEHHRSPDESACFSLPPPLPLRAQRAAAGAHPERVSLWSEMARDAYMNWFPEDERMEWEKAMHASLPCRFSALSACAAAAACLRPPLAPAALPECICSSTLKYQSLQRRTVQATTT